MLLTSVQHINCATMSWPPSFTGSNDAFCIQPRTVELSVKARMWAPCTSFWIVMYIDTPEARNYSRFIVITLFHSRGIYQRYAMNLSFNPLIPYTQALDHSVTVGDVKTMLFIGTTFYVTHCRIFIQKFRLCMCQDWSRCGPHFFPHFRRWCSKFSKYLYGVMMCAA